MEFIITIILGILSAALIAGGIVGYLKCKSTRAKAISAAAIAPGVVMLVLILLINPNTTLIGL